MGALEWRKEADVDWRPQLTTAVISLLLLERERSHFSSGHFECCARMSAARDSAVPREEGPFEYVEGC